MRSRESVGISGISFKCVDTGARIVTESTSRRTRTPCILFTHRERWTVKAAERARENHRILEKRAGGGGLEGRKIGEWGTHSTRGWGARETITYLGPWFRRPLAGATDRSIRGTSSLIYPRAAPSCVVLFPFLRDADDRSEDRSRTTETSTRVKEREIEGIGAPEHTPINTRASSMGPSWQISLTRSSSSMPLWRTDERFFFSIYLFRRTQQAHNSASIWRRARANDICIDMCRRWSPTTRRRLLQPRRPSETAVGAADPRRVCHCTGTRSTQRRVTSIPPLFRGVYISMSCIAKAKRPGLSRGQLRVSLSSVSPPPPPSLGGEGRLPSRVDRCAHRAADNAVVTTTSVHSTRRRGRTTLTGHTRDAENDDKSRLRMKRYGRARCQQSRARRRSEKRSMLAIER